MSLRARILLLVLAATLLPVAAMTWLLLQQRDQAVQDAEQELAGDAARIAAELENRVAGTAQLLFGLGRVPLLHTGPTPACSAFLGDVLKEHPQYTGLLVFRPNGDAYCDSLRTGRKLNVADRDYFRRALTTQGHVVEPVFGRLTGIAVLQIAYGIRDAEGRSAFVILASLNLERQGQAFAGSLPPGTQLRFMDREGRVLAVAPLGAAAAEKGELFPDPAIRRMILAQVRGASGVLRTADDAGLWAAASLPSTRLSGLRVTLTADKAALRSEADLRLRNALASLIVVAILIFAGAAALAEVSIRRQGARIIRAISRLDAGDFSTRLGAPYPRGEMGNVMAALDRTAQSLQAQRQEIASYQNTLEHQANYDALTGLPNRNLLADRLGQVLIHDQRAGIRAGVLLLDLDRFKTVNDSLGHTPGDELLREVAKRLVTCVRAGDTVSRLGGDEFVIVLAQLGSGEDAALVARKVLDTLRRPLMLAGHEISMTASVGISLFPQDGTTADDLLRHADVAMYRAKEQGGGSFAFFTQEMNQRAVERLEIESGLRRALAGGELELHYQPIVAVNGNRVLGAEALVRWRHPAEGLIPPDRFIPVAEESGLIIPLGEWVLDAACTRASAWREGGFRGMSVAVNLSAKQFRDPELAVRVAETLRRTGCEPSQLVLEITESTIMENPEKALAAMHQLRGLGIRLAIDDFGTGYSSLSALKGFPIQELKIDRSFVRDAPGDADDRAIVAAIVAMAKQLGLRLVAEGVETPEQLALLESLGCDRYQGYLYGKPLPGAGFDALLAARYIPG
jgi:diguanylate cyclase (GGDEF)-like protein